VKARRALSGPERLKLRRAVGAYLAYQAFAGANFFWPIFVLFYQRSAHLDLSTILFLQAFHTLVRVTLDVPLGLVADRFGRRMALASSAALMVFGCAVILPDPGLLTFAIAEFSFACSIAAKSGADSALLYDTLAEYGQSDDYPAVEGRAQSLSAMGGAASALLSGFLLEWWLPLPYVVTLTAATACLATATMLDEPPRATQDRHGFGGLARGAIVEILASPAVTWLIGLYTLLIVLSHVVFYLQQPYLEAIGVPATLFGVVVCATKLVQALSAHRAHRIEAAVSPRLLPGLLLLAALSPIVLMSIIGSPLGAVVVLLRGISDGLLTPVVSFYLNRLVAPLRRATVLSLASFVSRLTQGVVLAGFGVALARVSLFTTLRSTWLVGALVAAALLVVRRPAVARRPGEAAVETEARPQIREG
jgi:hypothetical protein